MYASVCVCPYSFAFTICPRVLSVCFFVFFVFFLLQLVLELVIIGGFLFRFGCSLLSFLLLLFNFFIFSN